MADEQPPQPPTPPAVAALSAPMVLGQYNHVHRTENDQVDSLEFGPANCRQKVYYNARDVEDGKRKINNAIAVMEYAMGQVREKGLEAAKKGGA